jgi:hypothetical protein
MCGAFLRVAVTVSLISAPLPAIVWASNSEVAFCPRKSTSLL